MGRIIKWMDRRFYPDHGDNWDDHALKARVDQVLEARSKVLDLGAGSGLLEFMDMRDSLRTVIGIDVDAAISRNSLVDHAVRGSGDRIPFKDATFDLVVSNNVLEHLEEPDATFLEIERVLKPDGSFLFKTPNRRHYVPLLARLIPQRLHSAVVQSRGRTESDVFQTRYRANSPKRVRRLAEQANLFAVEIETLEGRPEYGRIAWPLYVVGMLYERLVNSTRHLSGFRVVMLGHLKKKTGLPNSPRPPDARG